MGHPRAVQQPICTHQHPPPVVARPHRTTLLATAMLHHLLHPPTHTVSHLHTLLNNPRLILHLSKFPHLPQASPPKTRTRITRNMLLSNSPRTWLGPHRLDCNTLLFGLPRPLLIPPCRIGHISNKACTQRASSRSGTILPTPSHRSPEGRMGSDVCVIRET